MPSMPVLSPLQDVLNSTSIGYVPQPRVLIFTEAPLLAAGFRSLLAMAADALELESHCDDRKNLPERVASSSADVILIDCDPGEDLEIVARVLNRTPRANVVVWMHRPPIETCYQAMNLGVRGVLSKTASLETTVKCLQRVALGESWFDKEVSAGLRESREIRLTPRESGLVQLVSQGFRNKQIAAALSITEATVRVYLSALFRKVGVRDRHELASYGLRNMASHMSDSRLRLLVTRSAEAPAAGIHTARG